MLSISDYPLVYKILCIAAYFILQLLFKCEVKRFFFGGGGGKIKEQFEDETDRWKRRCS